MRKLHIDAEFESVFLINGQFCTECPMLDTKEGAQQFVTALPLSAALLPYTVKLVDGVAQNNKNLVVTYFLPQDIVRVCLKPRFNYVYTPQGIALRESSADLTKSLALRCFWLVKKGDLQEARKLLSEDLSRALDDNTLTSFFSQFKDAVPNDYYKHAPNGVIFIDKNNCGKLINTIYKNGLIDDLKEV